jgi:hypothetical protein
MDGTGYRFIRQTKANVCKETELPERELQRLHLLHCRSLFPSMPLPKRRPKCLAGNISSAKRWMMPDLMNRAAAARLIDRTSGTEEPNAIPLSGSDSGPHSRATTTSIRRKILCHGYGRNITRMTVYLMLQSATRIDPMHSHPR